MSRGGERAPVVADSVDRPTAGDDVAAALPVPVLAAVWCRSVGATWTVELHELDPGAALGTIVDWISSGVPISEPAPKAALARELLTARGFQLFPDSSAGPSCAHRHGIGYACRDTDLTEAGTRGARPGPGPVATPPTGPDAPARRRGSPHRTRLRAMTAEPTAEGGALVLVPEAELDLLTCPGWYCELIGRRGSRDE